LHLPTILQIDLNGPKALLANVTLQTAGKTANRPETSTQEGVALRTGIAMMTKMKPAKIKTLLAATVVLLACGSTASNAFTLSSMARTSPVIEMSEVAAVAYPAVCTDVSCGVATKTASDYRPYFRAAYRVLGDAISQGMQAAAASSLTLYWTE
jgi:hypothetical protein